MQNLTKVEISKEISKHFVIVPHGNKHPMHVYMGYFSEILDFFVE